ncbi:MAG: hypothetical protein ACOY3V_09955 [Pseudomonadota bacterium]
MTAIVVFLVLSVKFLLPSGYSGDLSRIGKGDPVVVLIRDKNTVQSLQLLEVMDDVRDKYGARVEFLVVDWNTEDGRKFMKTYQAQRATIVMLDGGGEFAKNIFAPQTAETMQQEIAATFGVTP